MAPAMLVFGLFGFIVGIGAYAEVTALKKCVTELEKRLNPK